MMNHQNQFDFNFNWMDFWMQQSKIFFDTANQYLQGAFEPNTHFNPSEHMKQIQQWLDALKAQWQSVTMTPEQKAYEAYWDVMTKLMNEASDLMVKQWIKQNKHEKPIESITELYEIWLNACHEVQQRMMHSAPYQQAYGELMNAAFKFWNSASAK